jgi:hypothetical protein
MAKRQAMSMGKKLVSLFSELGYGEPGNLYDDIEMFLVSRKRVYGDWPNAERKIILRNIDLVRQYISDRGMKATGRG